MTTTGRLTEAEIDRLVRDNNWSACRYDNNGILVRSLSGRDDDWHPVADYQLPTTTTDTQAVDAQSIECAPVLVVRLNHDLVESRKSCALAGAEIARLREALSDISASADRPGTPAEIVYWSRARAREALKS